jgi:hypothetical protein
MIEKDFVFLCFFFPSTPKVKILQSEEKEEKKRGRDVCVYTYDEVGLGESRKIKRGVGEIWELIWLVAG